MEEEIITKQSRRFKILKHHNFAEATKLYVVPLLATALTQPDCKLHFN